MIFNHFDVNKDGFITSDEFAQVLEAFGIETLNQAQIEIAVVLYLY